MSARRGERSPSYGVADLLNQFHTVGFRFVLAVVLDDVPRVPLETNLDPNKHTSLGLVYACIARGGYLGVEEAKKEVPPPLVFLREAIYPSRKTVEGPAFVSEKLCEEELTETGRLLSRVIGEFNDVFLEEGRTGDGSKAHPWC